MKGGQNKSNAINQAIATHKKGALKMFVTKDEFSRINVKKAFDEGNNFIKITDGRHSIYRVNTEYKVVDYKKGNGLKVEKTIPKYIKRKL